MQEEVPVSLPSDAEGYIRRECPTCEKEFKIHTLLESGEAGRVEEVELLDHYCPHCGSLSPYDHFLTPRQIKYVEEMVIATLGQNAIESLADVSKKSGSFLKVEYIPSEEPVPPEEVVDMDIVPSPCHDRYRVKVPSYIGSTDLFCLACGSLYTA